MKPERAKCYYCNVETYWTPQKNGVSLKCAGCGDRFPCKKETCGHVDCNDMRQGIQWEENVVE